MFILYRREGHDYMSFKNNLFGGHSPKHAVESLTEPAKLHYKKGCLICSPVCLFLGHRRESQAAIEL